MKRSLYVVQLNHEYLLALSITTLLMFLKPFAAVVEWSH